MNRIKSPDVSIKSTTGDNGRVSGAPLYVKGPLRGERHLVEDLAALNIGVGIPAEDTIVLAARQQQVRVVRTPRD